MIHVNILGHLLAAAPPQPWEWPQRPWVQLQADYAGPFMGQMFLILVGAHSNWMEVKAITTAASAIMTDQFRSIFVTHGLPEMLVTDNGSVFTSDTFKDIPRCNGIRHVTSAAYHPASNGLTERAVQTFQEMKKKSSAVSLETHISRFPFQ